MITIIGNIIADILIKPFDDLPETGTLKNVDEIVLNIGGCAANPAVILGNIGAPVDLIGTIGDDNLGRFLLGELKKSGVVTEQVKVCPGIRSSATIVCIGSLGERTFVTQIGASKLSDDSSINWDKITKTNHMHYGGFFTLPNLMGDRSARIFERARALGLTTSLDTAWDSSGKWLEHIGPSLGFVDFLMTNRDEGRQITGRENIEDICSVFHENGSKTVVLKLDKDGCFISSRQLNKYFPAYPTDVIDSTGAGDAFAAGFIFGIVNKLPLEEACVLGNVFGSMCIGSIGTTVGIRSIRDVTSFIRERKIQLSEFSKKIGST